MGKQETTYIFIDESGKPEVYSAKGANLVDRGSATKFLILAAIRCPDQLDLQQKIMDFKSQLLRDEELIKIFSPAYALDSFHAQTDYPQVRERFYHFIKSLGLIIDVLVIDKLKCYEGLKRNPGKMYGVMAGHLLKNLCHKSKKTEVIFSRKDTKLKLRQELEIEVERIRLEYINQHPRLKSEFRINYQHNAHYTHGGLQIADYVAYAVFQVFEHNNKEWYEILKKKIGKIHDVCNQKIFTRSNPL